MYRIILPIVSVLTLDWIILATTKRKIREKESIIWIILAILLIIISLFPCILDTIALILGIHYPPSLLFALGFVFIFLLCFKLSQDISLSRYREKELAQQISILKQRLKTIEELLSVEIRTKNESKGYE